MKMTKLFSTALLVGAIFIGQSVSAQGKMMKQETKIVGGAKIYTSNNIVEMP